MYGEINNDTIPRIKIVTTSITMVTCAWTKTYDKMGCMIHKYSFQMIGAGKMLFGTSHVCRSYHINFMVIIALLSVIHAGVTTTTTAAPCKCRDGNYCETSVSVKSSTNFFQPSWTIRCVCVCVCVCVCMCVCACACVHAIFNVCFCVRLGPTASASICP